MKEVDIKHQTDTTISESSGAVLDACVNAGLTRIEARDSYSRAIAKLGVFQHEQHLCKNEYGDPLHTDQELFDWAVEHDGKLIADIASNLQRFCEFRGFVPGTIDPQEPELRTFLQLSKVLKGLLNIEMEMGPFYKGGDRIFAAEREVFEVWNDLGSKILKYHEEARKDLATLELD